MKVLIGQLQSADNNKDFAFALFARHYYQYIVHYSSTLDEMITNMQALYIIYKQPRLIN